MKTSGQVKGRDGAHTHWSASVRCDRPGSPPDRFDLRWGRHAFKLSAVRRSLCFDDPAVAPTPASGFDTSVGVAVGTVDGVGGYTLRWTLRDRGSGHGDPVHLRLTDPDGGVVLEVAGDHKTQAAGQP